METRLNETRLNGTSRPILSQNEVIGGENDCSTI